MMSLGLAISGREPIAVYVRWALPYRQHSRAALAPV